MSEVERCAPFHAFATGSRVYARHRIGPGSDYDVVVYAPGLKAKLATGGYKPPYRLGPVNLIVLDDIASFDAWQSGQAKCVERQAEKLERSECVAIHKAAGVSSSGGDS
jgi:hypothetical protein